MFVKSLRLNGFKSFADPTLLSFEAGVNVIVGPNGSGKSNIADALSWVLGSQAPSSLRGASMEDVIFAGSSSRARLGMCEVELMLDNSSGVLPLDLSEVSISRSTDRSGASEYRINGAPCRLLDIMELLSDTGVGRSLHTVVGQGQLDQVLQARAEERRAFIEEAAQIGKYRRRKDRAVRKLDRVEDNLLRLNDVLSELTRALRPLKRQAKAASAYSELMSEHTNLRQRLTATELHRLARSESELDMEGEAHRATLLSDELAHVRALLQSAATEQESLVTAAEKAQEVAHRIALATDRMAALGRLAHERAALIGARLAAETEDTYRERIRVRETDRARWEAELDGLKRTADYAQGRAAELHRTATDARSTAEGAERALAGARQAETEAAQALVRAEGSEAAARATVGSLEARVQAVLERREFAERELVADARAIAGAEADVRGLEGELDATTQAAAEAETRLEEARENAERLKDVFGASHAEASAARARVQAFEEVERVLADMPDALTRIGPLVGNARDAVRLTSADESEARARLREAETVIEQRWLEVARYDEELRRLDALMTAAAERLGGARRRHENREVERTTLDDELARVKDALAAAERAATEERADIPARRASLEDAERRRSEIENASARARASLEESQRAAADAELEARAASERALAAQLRVEEAVAAIADAQAALSGLEDRRATLGTARAKVESVAEIAAGAAERGQSWTLEAQARAAAAREEAHAAERRLVGLRERERDLEQRLEEIARRRNQAEVRRAETRARSEAVGERAMEEWGLSVEQLLSLEPFDETAEAEARAGAEKLERDLRRLGPVNPHAAKEFEELAQRESFLMEQIEDLNSSRRDLMKIVREVDQTIVEVFGRAFEDVAREFEGVFDRLFPGGQGSLKLTDPDDVLNSGIEVEARPPGKNVKKLSLLSGGERSLVALAFLFAIFRARPSPFYLLDEVEAALDDVNLSRFLGLIAELEEHAQVMVVTHQKRTMEAADVLYGVSMNHDGVSLVVAKRMQEIVL
jgi:chromosome segregation protein